jgi:aspartate aminotransferase
MEPTWVNHYVIFKRAGKWFQINMYDPKTNGFKYEEVIDALANKVPRGSVVLMQACANNPTGIDPTEQQWIGLSKICKDKGLIPLVDSAYLGFVTGDFKKDSFPIRLLAEDGHKFFVCQSFSKNMGLYGERLGCLHTICKDKSEVLRIADYFGKNTSECIGHPTSYPARIVTKLLGSQEYRNEWLSELQEVTGRMLKVRASLLKNIKDLKTPGYWDHIINQRGLFTYTGFPCIRL